MIPGLRQVICLLAKNQLLSIDINSFLILAINILRFDKKLASQYIDIYFFKTLQLGRRKSCFLFYVNVNTRSRDDIIVSVSLIMQSLIIE